MTSSMDDRLFDEAPEDESVQNLEDGIACCLSGGGYRAMVFHLGSLWRLNELGILKTVRRFSSVSGGSITSAVLGRNWHHIRTADFSMEAFIAHCVEPIRRMARETIDAPAIGWGTLNPFSRISDQIVKAYDDHLFHGDTLQDLPDEPRWVINATNVKTGVLWRFSKPYAGDYRVGLIPSPRFRLAEAVAASTAFPPFLSPLVLRTNPAEFDGEPAELAPAFRNDAVLSDGGVYDNLGLETAIKRYRTLLVSDGGRPTAPDIDPRDDWAFHSYRIIEILQQQISSLRLRQLIQTFQHNDRAGAYWGLRTPIGDYNLDSAIDVPLSAHQRLASTETRLAAINDRTQEQLINLAYQPVDFPEAGRAACSRC